MKSLTGLPPSAYLKTTEEAKIPLALLERLVQELEAGSTPAYLAHFRPDVSGGLDEEQIRFIENRLRQFLDLEDRRIMVLTAAGQRDRLTPELRAQIETATDRWELEDFYQPFRPKRESPADIAIKQGLEGLAQRLGEQNATDRDLDALAAEYVKPDAGINTSADALRGAREILAQWWSEDAALRRDLRAMLRRESRLVIQSDDAAKNAAKSKYKNLIGYQARLHKVAWRQMMALRRAVRDVGLGFHIELPENKTVAFLLDNKVAQPSPEVLLQLGAVATRAFESYLTPSFSKELAQILNERCDQDAVASFQKNLRKILMTPPAGSMGIVGLETGRPGGWRAAIISPEGEFVEGAIVHRDGHAKDKTKDTVPGGATSDEPAAEASDNAPPAPDTKVASAETAKTEKAGAGATPATGGDSESSEAATTEAGATLDATPDATAEAAEPVATETEAAESQPEESQAASDAAQPAESEASDPAAQQTQQTDGKNKSAGAARSDQPAEETMPGRPIADSKAAAKEEQFVPFAELLKRHEIGAVVMPGSPGVRQVEKIVRSSLREAGRTGVFWTTVNEAGSWIYATSKASRRDMPNTSVAQRSAACLAKRLQDPLSALAGVDPRTLGIGQFHQSVDPRKLREGLRGVLESTAHRVGVNLNTAPLDLLALAPGMTERVAKRVVEHRTKIGKFTKREQLADVNSLSRRIYQQAVGFTRIYGGENPLDATGIHPDQYPAVERILAAAGVSAAEALEKPESLDAIDLAEIQMTEYPPEVLQAIVRQFKPSIRNPRGDFKHPERIVELRTDEDLKVGTKVTGVVTNVATFGVFMDIGADQDGLVHVSRMSDSFVKDPKTAAKVGDTVEVYIVALEQGGKRISLSMRDPAKAMPRPGRTRVDARKPAEGQPRRRRKEPRRERETKAIRRTFGPSEKEKLREEQDIKKLSLDEKLALLQSKYRTKI